MVLSLYNQHIKLIFSYTFKTLVILSVFNCEAQESIICPRRKNYIDIIFLSLLTKHCFILHNILVQRQSVNFKLDLLPQKSMKLLFEMFRLDTCKILTLVCCFQLSCHGTTVHLSNKMYLLRCPWYLWTQIHD